MKMIILLSFSGPLAHGAPDEEADTRQPVVVKTKRASILAHSLPLLIEIAEKHSPNIRKAQDSLTVARYERQNASKQWYPSLDLKAVQGLRGQKPLDNDAPKTPWTSG